MDSLWKSIQFHIRMVENYFSASILLSIICALLFVTYPDAFVVIIALAAGVLICLFLGLEKLFGKSLFGDEGNLYMVLPMPTKDLILGKTLVTGLWMFVLETLMLLTVLGFALMAMSSGMLMAGIEASCFQLIEHGMHAWEIGFTIGMMPISTILSGMFLGEAILACQLSVHARRNKAMKKNDIRLGVAFGTMIHLLFVWAVFSWADLLISGYMIQVFVMYLLYRFCKKQLHSNFDLV